MKTLDHIPFWAWLLVGCLLAADGCQPPRSPAAGDELEQLAATVKQARAVAAVTRAGCAILPDDADPEPGRRRRYCEGTVDGVEAQLLLADKLLKSAESCRAEANEACLADAQKQARQLRATLEQLGGGEAAPAPSASGGS